ncbi:transketolase C-terminal domain-containing protein, partial [Planctomycetota bacterium]
GKAIITIEDHYLSCGFGSAVLESASAALPEGMAKPIITLGMPPKFIKPNTRQAQLMEAGVNVDRIVKTVKKIIGDN